MLIDEIKPLIHWLEMHPFVGLGVSFLVSFLESLAVVGLLVPGSVMMTAIGTLVGSGIFPFWPTLIVAAIGAFLGDVLSFWLGHHYHDSIRCKWPVNRYPALINRGQLFFQKYGTTSVFIGRFIGPMRPIIPMLAGMMDMPVRPFLLTDFISAMLWAPAYMFPGMLIGAASLTLPPEIATRFILIALLAIFALWLCSWLIHRIITWVANLVSKLNAMIWKRIHAHRSGQHFCGWLNPQQPDDHSQLNRVILLFFLALLFAILIILIKHSSWLINCNHIVYHFFRSLRHPIVDHVMIVVTLLGDKHVIIPVFFVGFAIFYWRNYKRFAWHWLALIIFAAASIVIAKKLVAMPRPGWLGTIADFSFPSGHTTLATLTYGLFLLVYKKNSLRKSHFLASLLTVVIILAVIISRLYLGAHWLSDILGGLLLGTMILQLVWLSYLRNPRNLPKTRTLIGYFAVLFIVIGSAYYVVFHHKLLAKYQQRNQVHYMNHRQWWQHTTVPLVRYDRLNKPVEVLNLQWLGNLQDIKQTLLNHHWQLPPDRNLQTTLHHFAAKHGSHQLPLLGVLYQDKLPNLVLVHAAMGDNPPIVLRLWLANTQIRFADQQLYVGTVYYQPQHKGITLFHPNTPAVTTPQSAVAALLPVLKGYKIKTIKPEQLDLSNIPADVKLPLGPVVLIERQ